MRTPSRSAPAASASRSATRPSALWTELTATRSCCGPSASTSRSSGASSTRTPCASWRARSPACAPTTSRAVLHPGHADAAGARPLALERLAGETWIAGCVRCRAHLLHVARASGFEPRIAYATDDYVTVQSLVSARLGVTLLPALALVAARRDDVAVRALAGGPGRTVEVILPAADRRPPAVAAMLAALHAAARALAATPAAAALGVTAA